MKGVLLMAYGSPRTTDDVAEYYTDIMGGVRPSDEHIGRLTERYKAIGGASPLYDITKKQAAKLQDLLDSKNSDAKVYFGMKHSKPFIRDAVAAALSDGITDLLCIALAPHYSITGIGSYISRVKEANAGTGEKLRTEFVESWHLNENLIRLWSDNIRKAGSGGAFVIFSAHSLPEDTEDKGPYKKQLLETASAIAKRAGISDWALAFQSQGRSGGRWYGPTIKEAIEAAGAKGRTSVIAPIGFLSDNLEILYDLDIDCRNWAKEEGIALKRAEMPNDSSLLIDALYGITKESK